LENNKTDLQKENNTCFENDINEKSVLNEENKSKKTKINKKTGVIALILVVVACIVGVSSSIRANAYKAPIDSYFSAIQNSSGQDMQKAYGESMVSVVDNMFKIVGYYDTGNNTDIDTVFDEMVRSIRNEDIQKSVENIKIQYKIIDKHKLLKVDLDQYIENTKSRYGKSVEASEGYDVYIIKYYDDDKQTWEYKEIRVLKIDDKWVAVNDRDFDYFYRLIPVEMKPKFF